jgi:AAA+ superfamily predicted ATPase
MYSKIIVSTILLIVCSFLCHSIFKDLQALQNDTSHDSYDHHNMCVLDKNIRLNHYEKHIHSKCFTTSLDSVPLVGHQTIVDELESIAHMWSDECKNGPLYKPPTGILLYGPPGTGKTTLSKHIANKLFGGNVSFMNVSSDTFDNKYQGEGLKYLRAVFTLAAKVAPCVVFFDEIDGFMTKRSDTDQTHVHGMKTTFLSGMDYLNDRPEYHVLVVCATNRPKSLDKALMRRMEIQFHTGYPSLDDKCNTMSQFQPLQERPELVRSFVTDVLPETSTLHDIHMFLRFCVRRQKRVNTEWSSDTLITLYNEYKSVFKFV